MSDNSLFDRLVAALFLILTIFPPLTIAANSVESTVLIVARDDAEAGKISLGLDGYGIPWDKALIPQGGTALPALNSSGTQGRYGAIVVYGSVSYDQGGGRFASALTDQQWNDLYAYQTAFKVRMARLDEFPGPSFGAATVIENTGCCEADQEQLLSLTNTEAFSGANLKTNAQVSTKGLFHYPASITQPANTTEFASFEPAGRFTAKSTAAVFRLRPGDLDAHVDWQRRLNGRLPGGSDFWLEMGHNGNGDIIAAVDKPEASGRCKPNRAVDYPSPPDTPPDQLEQKKPPGTGVDLWPTEFEQYGWTEECARLDELASWFFDANKANAFAHVSHTFTHEELNNATYHDATREIYFNQAWLKQLRLDQAQRFSAQGIIPPAITGLHNADAIQAWTDNGIRFVVGDNTRPALRNAQSRFWPLPSSVESNGREGILIVPRFATTIFYNCDTPDCTLQEWKDTSAGRGEFPDLLDDARRVNTRNLLGLQADPYMFHQANLRQTDMDSSTIGSETGKMSLIMSWVETIVQEMTRLTDWPVVSLKHDDLAGYFQSRMTLDACKPRAQYAYSGDGNSIESVTVSADDNSCSVPVAVTIPGGEASADGGSSRADKVGSEPPIVWVTLSGSPVTLRLGSPVKV